MHEFISRWLLTYPAFFIRGEKYHHYYREAAKVDKMSLDEIERYQEYKIEKLLEHCYRTNPYYSKIIQKISSEKNLNNYNEIFQHMPLLTKDVIREKMLEIKPKWNQRLDKRTTSGSTGMPLTFYKDRNATAAMEAAQHLAFSWHGIKLGEPQARFWGMPAGRAKIIAVLKDILKNRCRFSAFDLNETSKIDYIKKINKVQPTYIYGYPSLIKEFGTFLNDKSYSTKDIPLKKIIGTGEYVSKNDKELIEQSFNVPFIDEYGCGEIGVIGFQCPYKNMHVMSSNVKVEVINNNNRMCKDGEEGEIVITELNEKKYPFIRYRIGDRGTMIRNHDCPCKRESSLILVSQGRIKSYIVTPEGKKVNDTLLTYTLKHGIHQFKAIQESVDLLYIYVVPNSYFEKSFFDKYEYILKQQLSEKMKVRFELVEHIERSASGKLFYFESNIDK